MKKFIKILLLFTMVVAFLIPNDTISAVSNNYRQITSSDQEWQNVTGGAVRTVIDDYDVVIVKQSTFLAVWTMHQASSDLQAKIKNNVIGKTGLGAMNINNVCFFSGVEHCPKPIWAKNTFGDYWVTYENGHYYMYAVAISHFIVGTKLYDNTEPAIKAKKEINGTPGVIIPDFSFSLTYNNIKCGSASISSACIMNFTLNDNFKLPDGQQAVTLKMTEDKPQAIHAGWSYSSDYYYVKVYADGTVEYQDEAFNKLIGFPVFINTYTQPYELSPIQAEKSIKGSPTGTIPTFNFILKDEKTQETVGRACIDKVGTVTFNMDGFNLPEENNTVILDMYEEKPEKIPTGWTYSGDTYKVAVNSNGAVTYENNKGSVIIGIPVFTNTYNAPETPVPGTNTPGTAAPETPVPETTAPETVSTAHENIVVNPNTGGKNAVLPYFTALMLAGTGMALLAIGKQIFRLHRKNQ